ncbi:MAG: T9SS type A sorting domain-containing protein [Ignavibacteriae bacterium]|nr:T9SS type A sorting domain-containing protein [Ignavibacteriota bacterium]
MKHIVVFVLAALVFSVIVAPETALAQRTAIRVEAMDIHRLHEMGLPNPNNWDNVSSGLTSVGIGNLVWLSGWDITGDTTWKTGPNYLWELATKPGASTATLDSSTTQWTTFRPDIEGLYAIRLTIAGKDTTVTLSAGRFMGTDRHNLAGAPLHCGACHSGGAQFQSWKNSGHAKIFENGMNGVNGAGWGANCFKCHTAGFNLGTTAANGGFDDVAATLGFIDSQWKPWRPGLYDSLLTTDKKMLTLVAGISCENCHGAKNPTHFGLGTQPKTMDAGVCGQCHNEPWRHNRFVQWEFSPHSESIWSNSFRSSGANPISNYNLSACVRCHDGQAYVNFIKGIPFDNRTSTGYSAIKHTKITCQTCHDPHSGGLRSAPTTSDTLGNGYNYSSMNLGEGKTCFNCHKYRRNESTYVSTALSSHWGPHYRGAADVFLGKNGHTFGATIPSSIAHQLVEKTCVGCHMSATPDTGTVARDKIGMHTWKMSYEYAPGQHVDNVTGCASCHTGIARFDDIIAAFDYDGDGTIESFIGEVHGLSDKLAMALPPYGTTDVNWALIAASPDSVQLKKAYWNYLYVKYDGSYGVHNPKYVVGLLQKSVTTLTGVEFKNGEGVPAEFALHQNYPNPFNPSTRISFALPKQENARLQIFDMLGRLVNTLVDENLDAGTYDVTWNGTDRTGASVASGVYLYRLETSSFASVRKMLLVK